MKFWVIRHIASGELMPQLKRGRGYSWWNPSNYDTSKLPITGSPRLFPSLRIAKRCKALWFSVQNGKNYYHHDRETGYSEVDLEFKPDNRKKEDIEIVEVELTIQ